MKRSHKILCLLGLSISSIAQSNAAIINITSRGANIPIITSAGDIIADGSLAVAGTFSDFSSIENQLRTDSLTNIATLINNPTQFNAIGDFSSAAGSGAGNIIFTSGLGSNGFLSSTISDVTNAHIPQGSQFYLLAFNSDTLATSTEFGIYTSSLWVMPLDQGDLTTINLATQNITNTPDDVIRGSFDGAALRLEAVPEPSAAILLAKGLSAAAEAREAQQTSAPFF